MGFGFSTLSQRDNRLWGHTHVLCEIDARPAKPFPQEPDLARRKTTGMADERHREGLV